MCSVVMHHRQDGRFLSQTQEELILIGAFGLFCLGTSQSRLAQASMGE